MLLSVHLQTRLPADGGSGADPLELEAALQQLQVTHTEPTFQRFHSPPGSFTFGSQKVGSSMWVIFMGDTSETRSASYMIYLVAGRETTRRS